MFRMIVKNVGWSSKMYGFWNTCIYGRGPITCKCTDKGQSSICLLVKRWRIKNRNVKKNYHHILKKISNKGASGNRAEDVSQITPKYTVL